MFEYRLSSWPDLPSQFDRVGYRRALSDMSQRYVSVARLAQTSGLPRGELLRLIETLETSGALMRRERAVPGLFRALGRAGEWLESALGIDPTVKVAPIRSHRSDRRSERRH